MMGVMCVQRADVALPEPGNPLVSFYAGRAETGDPAGPNAVSMVRATPWQQGRLKSSLGAGWVLDQPHADSYALPRGTLTEGSPWLPLVLGWQLW